MEANQPQPLKSSSDESCQPACSPSGSRLVKIHVARRHVRIETSVSPNCGMTNTSPTNTSIYGPEILCTGASTKLLGPMQRWSRDNWLLLSASRAGPTRRPRNKVLVGSGPPPIVREFEARQEILWSFFFIQEERSGASVARDMGHLPLVSTE